MGLLDRTAEKDGRRVLLFPWEGRDIQVWDDCDTALRVIELFERGGNAREKLSELVSRLFVEPSELSPVSDFSGLLAAVCWECCGLDIDGSHQGETGGEKVFDWDADGDYIAASLLMCYGVSWDTARYEYSYRQMCSMLGLVAFETPMGQALYYRTAKPPEPTKYNEEERKRFRRARDFWKLREPGRKDTLEDVNDRMNDAFSALERLARS